MPLDHLHPHGVDDLGSRHGPAANAPGQATKLRDGHLQIAHMRGFVGADALYDQGRELRIRAAIDEERRKAAAQGERMTLPHLDHQHVHSRHADELLQPLGKLRHLPPVDLAGDAGVQPPPVDRRSCRTPRSLRTTSCRARPGAAGRVPALIGAVRIEQAFVGDGWPRSRTEARRQAAEGRARRRCTGSGHAPR